MPASCQCFHVRHMDASYVQAVHRHAMHSALTETCLCILIREPELRVHVIFITGQIQRIYDTDTPCPSATAGRRFSSGCKYRAATKNSRYKNHKQRMQDLELCSAVERSGRHQLPSPSLRVVCSDHAHLLFNCVFLSLQTAIHGTAEACRLSAKPCSLLYIALQMPGCHLKLLISKSTQMESNAVIAHSHSIKPG